MAAAAPPHTHTRPAGLILPSGRASSASLTPSPSQRGPQVTPLLAPELLDDGRATNLLISQIAHSCLAEALLTHNPNPANMFLLSPHSHRWHMYFYALQASPSGPLPRFNHVFMAVLTWQQLWLILTLTG